jgi:phage terminase small subunit
MAHEALSDRHKVFVDEYIKDFNASRAYMAAYPDCSADAAPAAGARLLNNVKVERAIDERKAARSKRTEITQDRVLLEIARLAFSDPRTAFNADGSLKPVHQWDDATAASISSIKVKRVMEGDTPTEVAEIKFWDKGKQLELAGRHLAMFTDKTKVEGGLEAVVQYIAEIPRRNAKTR